MPQGIVEQRLSCSAFQQVISAHDVGHLLANVVDHDVDGYFNPLSMHGGCPPGPGEEKWIAQRWFYQRPSRVGRGVYGDVYRSPYAHRSADLDPRCKMWAADGECLNNGDFMSSECAQSCREHADADLAQSSVKDEL